MGSLRTAVLVVVGLTLVGIWAFHLRVDGPLSNAQRISSLWTVVDQVRDQRASEGLLAFFVEINHAAIARREVYVDAVRKLCGAGTCRVMFFAPGDPRPASSSFKAFADSGGFGHRNLAVWSANDASTGKFSSWDCNRAGAENAPAGALCGRSAGERRQ